MRLLPILFGFTNCSSGGKDTGLGLSHAEQEANANVACASYSVEVCDLIYNRCNPEMSEAWGVGSESYDEGEAWEYECRAVVQPDCVGFLMSAEDFAGAALVASSICYQGYDYEHYEEMSAATCDDLVELDDNFSPEFPYLDWCPCLATGRWRTIVTSDRTVCY